MRVWIGPGVAPGELYLTWIVGMAHGLRLDLFGGLRLAPQDGIVASQVTIETETFPTKVMNHEDDH